MSWISKHVGTCKLDMPLDEVIGKERPRSTYNGGYVRTYTPPRTHKAEETIKAAWLKANGFRYEDFTGEVRIRVVYWRALAKSNPKWWAGRADLSKPDCDNVLKLVMDALTGAAYREDSQVTCAAVRKMPRIPFISGNRIHIVVSYYMENYRKGE